MELEDKEYLEYEAQAEKEAPVLILTSLLNRIFEENFSIDNDEDDLNQSTVRLILALSSKKPGITQQEIVKISHLKCSTISIALGKLEEKEIIEKIPDRYDHRSSHIYLTEKGESLNRKRIEIVHNLEQFAKRNIPTRDIHDAIYVLKNYAINLIDKKEIEK